MTRDSEKDSDILSFLSIAKRKSTRAKDNPPEPKDSLKIVEFRAETEVGAGVRLVKVPLYSFFAVKTVSDARHGENEAWMSRVRLDFPAQLTNVNMEIVGFGAVSCPPYLG